MGTLVGIVSVVVNVGVSFMTDGNWKTAGTGLAQFYWNHTERRRQASPRRLRLSWNAALSSVPAFD